MNIVIVSVLLSIAVVILVPIGFVFGGPWGGLLAVFILLWILAVLYVAEAKSVKAAILRERIAAGKATLGDRATVRADAASERERKFPDTVPSSSPSNRWSEESK